MRCANCSRPGHSANVCPSGSGPEDWWLRACPNCNVTSHGFDDCPMLKVLANHGNRSSLIKKQGEILFINRLNKPQVFSDTTNFADWFCQHGDMLLELGLSKDRPVFPPWSAEFARGFIMLDEEDRPRFLQGRVYPSPSGVGHQHPRDLLWLLKGIHTFGDLLKAREKGDLEHLRLGADAMTEQQYRAANTDYVRRELLRLLGEAGALSRRGILRLPDELRPGSGGPSWSNTGDRTAEMLQKLLAGQPPGEWLARHGGWLEMKRILAMIPKLDREIYQALIAYHRQEPQFKILTANRFILPFRVLAEMMEARIEEHGLYCRSLTP